MEWFAKVSDQKIPLVMNGETVGLNQEQLSHIIKERIKSSQALMSLFEEFDVSPDRLENLIIEVAPLEGKYAETDAERMTLNSSLFQGGDFFESQFFIVAHEIVHWLSRVREQDAYLNDPEETLGFVSSVAYEMEQGSDFDTVWNKVYPKINWHFHDEGDAREVFMKMIEKAKDILHRSREIT